MCSRELGQSRYLDGLYPSRALLFRFGRQLQSALTAGVQDVEHVADVLVLVSSIQNARAARRNGDQYVITRTVNACTTTVPCGQRRAARRIADRLQDTFVGQVFNSHHGSQYSSFRIPEIRSGLHAPMCFCYQHTVNGMPATYRCTVARRRMPLRKMSRLWVTSAHHRTHGHAVFTVPQPACVASAISPTAPRTKHNRLNTKRM